MPSQPQKKTPKKRKTSRTKINKRKRSSKKPQSRVKRDLWIAFVLMILVLASGLGHYHYKGDVYEKELTKKKVVVQKEKRVVEVEKKTEFLVTQEIDARREKAMKATYEDEPFVPDKEIVSYGKSHQAMKEFTHFGVETSIPSKFSQFEWDFETEVQTAKTKKKSSSVVAPVTIRGKRPRLVIIIDDVATPRQLKKIQSVPLKLTPSIFPPSKRLRSTVKMTKKLKHYVVHIPMEAGNHPRGSMLNTITVKDSKEQMRARVKQLRKWFPSAIYINNHTGSIFTSDYRALHTMYGLLKKEGFVFVDSRTSHKSKGKRVAKEYGDFYLRRDVFIDNVQKFATIRKQLKLAVKIAKKRGYAIAIGHPHKMTIKSLKNSLDILVDVDVVYLDELMKN